MPPRPKKRSRWHVEFAYFRDHNTFVMKDLGTSNGTYLNGNKIVSNKWHAIDDEDIVSFGGPTDVRS